jgi:hypothetical protein
MGDMAGEMAASMPGIWTMLTVDLFLKQAGTNLAYMESLERRLFLIKQKHGCYAMPHLLGITESRYTYSMI